MTVEDLAGSALCGFARLLTGMRAVWCGSQPAAGPRVYFANHRSHGDFVLIWGALPPPLRRITRPVAGADYWQATAFRRVLAGRVLRAILIDRESDGRIDRSRPNPLAPLGDALAAGQSLILFPEGTRNPGDGLLPFKSGIYHLAKARPDTEFVPVWIENVGRVMPKGKFIPVPLLCSLTFGPVLTLAAGENRTGFLNRCRDALLALAPPPD